MPSVASTRTEYDDLFPRWELIRDCISGSHAVKKRRTQYLPMPGSLDDSAENARRYEDYLKRAVFYNITARTLKGLVGQVMRKDPVIELPALIGFMEGDADGAGVNLRQHATKALGDVLAYSRAGLFIDYPAVEGPVTRAQQLSGLIRPSIVYFQPWDIINWRTRKIGGVHKLSLVVLSEQYVTDDDGFEEEFSTMWRVLRLDETNLYRMEEWIENPEWRSGMDQDYKYVLNREVFPRDYAGNRLDYIPFVFLGAVNNSPDPDMPVLYDMAELNLSHYINSADYEESVHMSGQPTPWLSGLTQDWVTDVLKGEVRLGSRAAIPLPEGGSAGLLQVSPNTLPKEAMDQKEKQMIALGAKVVEQARVERTATEIIVKDISENSILGSVARNVSEGYEQALEYALNFVGPEADVVFELNTEFEVHRLDPNEQAQLINLWQNGAITEEEMRDQLRKAGIAYLTDEDYRDQKEVHQ